MKLIALTALIWVIVWALLSALHGFTKENWQALEPTTRWLLKEAAPCIGVITLIAIMVIGFMVAAGDS